MTLEACARQGAEDRGEIWQRDTYFHVPVGGLKLREERPGEPQLIQFARADQPQARESRYRIAMVNDAGAIAVLSACLGVRGTVTKRRRLFLWRDVRIHLDDVEQLGTFVELEAVAAPGSDLAHEHRLIDELRRLIGIADERLVARGYADWLLPGRAG